MSARVVGFVMALTLGSAVMVIAQSWTAPRTWSDGETVTASLLNTHVRDNLTVLRAGGVAIASQGANEIIYASSSSQLARSADLTFASGTLTVSSTSTGAALASLSSSGANSNISLALDNDADTWTVGIDGGASDDFYVFNAANVTKRLSITPAGALTVTGQINSASAQPGFLAYNSATDTGQSTGATVDFDAEVFDNGSHFATDTFTAPVTGQYHFCATVTVSNGLGTTTLSLVTTAATYQFVENGPANGALNGCTYVSMTATNTAHVTVGITSGTIDVNGGATPRVTFFSGRLVP